MNKIKTVSSDTTIGTSFYGHTITCPLWVLIKLFGEPTICTDEEPKSVFEWPLEIQRPDGSEIVFTLYDWKEEKSAGDLRFMPEVEWHIGANSEAESLKAKVYLDKTISRFLKVIEALERR